MKTLFKTWTMFEKVWLCVFLAALMYVQYASKGDDELVNIVSVISTVAGLFCVILVAKGNIWNFAFGVVNVSTYAFVCYKSGYGGDFILNSFYYLPMQLIGFYFWSKHYNSNDDVVKIRKFKMIDWLLAVILLTIGTYIIQAAMPQLNALFGMPPNPLPIVDALTTTGSIYAQILMTRRFREQWVLWILINGLSMAMWIKMNNLAMSVMWTAFMINAIYGLYNWSKEMKVHGEDH